MHILFRFVPFDDRSRSVRAENGVGRVVNIRLGIIADALNDLLFVVAGVISCRPANDPALAGGVGRKSLGIAVHLGNFDGKLLNIDYSFLGMNLGSIPDWKIWNFDFSSADILATIGLFLIPIIAAFLSWASMKISQATNPPQAGQAQMSMKTMNLMMPIMSIWICFIMPAALGVYWIANSCFGIVRDLVLTKHYKRKLDIEDAERIAAQKEKEAERARRHEEHEQLKVEGATTRNNNTSKKKMQAQQKQADAERIAASERAEREARREKLGIEKPENPSQVGKRRYARGRAYDPSRYADEMAAAEEVNEPVEETAAQTEGEPEQSQENSET